MTTETIYVYFIYDKEVPSLDTIAEPLATHEEVELDISLDETDLTERSTLFYEYGPLIENIELGGAGAFPPDGAEEGRLRISESKFGLAEDNYDVDANACRHLIDLTKYLYETVPTQPVLVCSTSPTFEVTTSPLSKTEAEDVTYPRKYITWLDIYPPAEVAAIGREKLLSAPAPRVEELSNGSVLIASKHPLEIGGEALMAVSNHLGISPWGDYCVM